MSRWLMDLVADRLQQFFEGRAAEDAAKLRAIVVNDTDVFDDNIAPLPRAPLEIEPVSDGELFASFMILVSKSA